MTQQLAEVLAPQTRGYVAVREWESEGRRCRSLQFPGLPIPLEPSFAIHRGMLWIGASRQALLGALAHADAAAAGDEGLGGDPRFVAAIGGDTNDLFSVSWQDSAELLEDGYCGMMLATTALAATAVCVTGALTPL